jgi:signal transduction histidine kinase
MFGHYLVEVLRYATWGVLAFALWKGDMATRIAAATYAVVEVATLAYHPTIGDVSGESIALAIDFFCAVTFLVLAVRYANLWLGAAMLFQAAQFSLHAYYLVMELPHDVMHAWINNGDDWGILISMIVGTILAIRRRAAFAREEAELEARRKQRSSATP